MKRCPSFNSYSVTADGKVFTHRRKGRLAKGLNRVDFSYSKELSQFTTSKGYRTVSVYIGNGKSRPIGVHQLVADAFIGPVPENQEVRHLNGIPSDYRYENLAYGTKQDNANDRVQHGGYKQGASHINAKLNQGQVESVRKKRASGSKVKDLAKEFAVSTSTIELVLYGKSYKVNQGGAS